MGAVRVLWESARLSTPHPQLTLPDSVRRVGIWSLPQSQRTKKERLRFHVATWA